VDRGLAVVSRSGFWGSPTGIAKPVHTWKSHTLGVVIIGMSLSKWHICDCLILQILFSELALEVWRCVLSSKLPLGRVTVVTREITISLLKWLDVQESFIFLSSNQSLQAISPLTAKMSTGTSTLYTNATIITINPNREVILDGSLLVTGSRIAAIGKTSSFPPSSLPPNAKTISLKNRILLPGLINTHSHLAQSLLRGLAEDLPLHSWLCDAIWPLEASYDAEDGYIAARLTIAEMLRSGTTCFLESMLTHRSGFENVIRAVGESGIRACLVLAPPLPSQDLAI
jgi:hypothetical protein